MKKLRFFIIKLLAGNSTIVINATLNQDGLHVRNNSLIHCNYIQGRVFCCGNELRVNGDGRLELV